MTTPPDEADLVQQYLPLALRLAKRTRALDLDQVESDAQLALLLALRSFNRARSYRSLASWLHLEIPRRMVDLLRQRTGRTEKSGRRRMSRLRSLQMRVWSGSARISSEYRPITLGDTLPGREPPPDAALARADLVSLILCGEKPRDQRIMRDLLAGDTMLTVAQREGLSEAAISAIRSGVMKRALWGTKGRTLRLELEGGVK